MTGFLVGLCYLGVLALVVGCFVYLFVTRDQSPASTGNQSPVKPPRERELPPFSEDSVMKAEALSGSYRLSDLERIFEQLGAIGAWGMVLELNFAAAQEDLEMIQMVVYPNEVELCSPILEPSYTDPFRRAVTEAGLQARPGSTEGQLCVDVTGTWPRIASVIRSIIQSVHGVGDSEEAQARIFG
jgi:predicted lipid-binding transport protein (Tim44 family)